MSNKLVTFDQFNSANLKSSEPIPKQIKKPNETINYNDIKLSYNYGTNEDPIIQDLFFEAPILSSLGVTTKEEQAQGKNGSYTKVTSSMMCIFDLADTETREDAFKGLTKLDELHSAAAHVIAASKGKLKMHDFDPSRPGGVFKNPVYWHRDEVTGEKVKGKNPSIWVKLKNSPYNKTLFTDIEGRPIDWKLLKGVNITMLPLFHFEKIYIGSKASLQIYLASAIILKIVQAGTESRQTSTMDKLKEKYGSSLTDQVEAQLANIRMSQQDSLQESVPLPPAHTDFGSDYSEGTMQPMSESNSAPNTSSLKDFLSNAPQMNDTPAETIRLTVPPMKIN